MEVSGKRKEVFLSIVIMMSAIIICMGITAGKGSSLSQGVRNDWINIVYGQLLPMTQVGELKYRSYGFPLFSYMTKYLEQENSAETVGKRVQKARKEEEIDKKTLEELFFQENEVIAETKKEDSLGEEKPFVENSPKKDFVLRKKQRELDWETLASYEGLLKEFYTIDANTFAGSDQLSSEKLLKTDLAIDKSVEGPQILIYHTHSQEEFADSIPGDESTTIVGVGEYLTKILTETYGYQVLHHLGHYDVENRNDAYSKALPDIEGLLQDNPSIQVVIDLHRDEMAEENRLVMDLDGRQTARFMFFNGMSRTKKTGDLAYLKNENQEENLAFSFQMKRKAEEYYPGLTRKIYLKGYRYNMHVCPKTLLVELGAQNNTLEEVMNACDPLAHILHMVLSGEK